MARGLPIQVAIFASLLLTACSREDISSRCAAAFAELARTHKIDAKVTGARVILPGVELRFEARIEADSRKESQSVVALAVTASPARGTSLITGSVGIGTTRAEALATAIDEWIQV